MPHCRTSVTQSVQLLLTPTQVNVQLEQFQSGSYPKYATNPSHRPKWNACDRSFIVYRSSTDRSLFDYWSITGWPLIDYDRLLIDEWLPTDQLLIYYWLISDGLLIEFVTDINWLLLCLIQAVQPYVCTVEPLSNECLAAGRVVTPTQNRTIGDLSESGQSLVNIIPTVTSLTNCSFVYDTFNALVTERCSPAKQSLRNLWIPLLLLSIAMTLLSLAWILANHRNKKQRYSRTIHSQESPRGYK